MSIDLLISSLKRGLPRPEHIKDAQVRQVVQAMGDMVEILERTRGDIRDSAVRVGELIDTGVWAIDGTTVYSPLTIEEDELIEQAPGNQGVNATIHVLTAAGQNIHLVIVDGLVSSFASVFVALSADGTSQDITVSGGSCVPDGTYVVLDPLDGSSRDMVITAGKVTSLI